MQMMDVSDEVWIWVHQKYEMSRIIWKLYKLKKKLLLPRWSQNEWFNRQSNETYHL